MALRAGGRFPLQADWERLRLRLLALHDSAFVHQRVEGGKQWLRFLHFLAEAAGLLGKGLVQPLLWSWMRQAAEEQSIQLWQPFAPPKEPSDPTRWIPVINLALEQKLDLLLLHWSAGRNLAVRRRVTPFYIDEQRFGGAALRGWCHQSGRDLWFRLDRIMEMEVV